MTTLTRNKLEEQNMTDAVSINPGTFIEGGLFDGVLTITEAKFVDDFNYGGKQKATLAAILTFINEDGESNEQAYSCGDPKKFTPSDDGKKLIPVGNSKQLFRGSNFFLLMQETANAGFPGDKMSDSIDCLEGLHADFTRKAQAELTKRQGIGKEGATILVPTEIITLPGEDGERFEANKKAPQSKKSQPGGKKKEAAPADSEVTDAAVEAIMEVITDNDGSITKKALVGKLMKSVPKDNANRKAILSMAAKNDFLSGDDATWEFDGSELTLG
jgi:hypothetical protein